MAQINRPTDYFNTKLYTGNGTTGHNITGVGFQPDWLWIKERSSTSAAFIYDIIRGVDIKITPSTTDGDATNLDSMSSFDSDGFTVGVNNAVNENTQTYASWNWLASNTTASNTDGSITSTVSANTTSGFSIVTWTTTGTGSDTVGHGLGATPKIVLMKRRDSTSNWTFYTTIVDGTLDYLSLNLTDAKADSGWSLPTSSVFSQSGIGGDAVAYCFAEKKGFSKFGSYTGNGNADGTFVYTGLSPSFVLLKETSNANNWMIFDNKRSPFNLRDDFISPDISDAETTGNANNRMDMLSNGFKIRGTGSATNRSGSTFIYMAFASEPLVGSNNVCATAR